MRQQREDSLIGRVIEDHTSKVIPDHTDLWSAIQSRVDRQRRRTGLVRVMPATRLGWAITALALFLILGAVAYAAEPVLSQLFRIGVIPMDGPRYSVDEWADVADKVPFDIIIPTYLPYGMQLKGVDVSVPSAMFDEEARRRTTRVSLNFSNQDKERPASFILYESIALSRIGDNGATPITLRGVQGMLLEDKERQFVSMAWAGCNLGFSLTASTAGKLSKEDVIRIAESTLNCKQLGLKGSATK